MTRREQVRDRVAGKLTSKAGLLCPFKKTWSDGVERSFDVKDPNRTEGTLARSLRARPDGPDVRILQLLPGVQPPPPGAHISWEHGVLFVERHAQTSSWSGRTPAVCRFVDPARSLSYPLTFTAAGPLVQDPKTHNMVPGAGVPLPTLARLEATADPQIREAVGADTASVVLFGRWGPAGQPQARPVGVRWGSKAPLTLQGQPGTLTVKLAWPDPDPVQTLIHGAAFIAVWSSP
ncbi:hypothetical protein [Deinococcus sp. Leaf326]|uniref:hypothetical protein n=1 Tax=Deinococcus sp. Leaf326 TaxID=1736338 RepID=UPI000700924D|nr:hypothetical protein [Deinococcus sp. Leaf326]KQR40751.1 hypothetical protein ASF71_00860 [Deinococcus sp. Leaf326]